jgi:hypothetical protein
VIERSRNHQWFHNVNPHIPFDYAQGIND